MIEYNFIWIERKSGISLQILDIKYCFENDEFELEESLI